jgi:hypothetical protein
VRRRPAQHRFFSFLYFFFIYFLIFLLPIYVSRLHSLQPKESVFMDTSSVAIDTRRYIVIVPEHLENIPTFANKIRWMATQDRRNVVYLALADSEESLLSASRDMTEIKAITSDQWLNVKVVVSIANNWLSTLKTIFQPGDIVICQEEQLVSTRPFQTLPACAYLRDALKYPVCTVAGFYHPVKVQTNNWLRQVRFWAGSLAILAGFFVIEANLDSMAQGIAHSLLMAVIILFEIGAMVTWFGISG